MRKTSEKILLIGSMFVGAVFGAEFWVDQAHPAASDENPGTAEKPWKTIAHAVKTAKAGDTVKIRGGLYREGNLGFANRGERVFMYPQDRCIQHPLGGYVFRYITIEADGPEAVIVDGSVPIPPDQWTPVPDVPGLYVAPVRAHGWLRNAHEEAPQPTQIGWVFRDGQPLSPCVSGPGETHRESTVRFQPKPARPGTNDVWQWYHDLTNGLLYLNFGERKPMEAGLIEASVYPAAFQGFPNEYLALRGLTIRRFGGRTIDFTRVFGAIIEDCLLQHCGSEAIAPGTFAVVRRNTVLDVNGVGIAPWSHCRVDENLVIRNFRDMFQTRYGYMGSAIQYFGSDGIRFRNNVVLESPGNGFWPDVPSSADHVHLGNSVGYCKGYGFYIEMPAQNNIIMRNVAFHNEGPGICLRGNFNNTVSENYVFGSRTGITLIHTELYAWMKNNQVVGNWIRDAHLGLHVGPGFEGRPQTRQFTDRNVFHPSVKTVAVWGGQPYATLEEYRATGNEPHGESRDFDEAELGLVSFRVADSSRPWEPVKMFGNPRCAVEHMNWGSFHNHNQPYFWHYGTADATEYLRWRWEPWGQFVTWPDLGGVLRASAFDADWGGYLVSENLEEDRAIKARQKDHGDSGALEVASRTNQAISARGLGYWSPSLPTAPGAVTDIRLHLQARGVEAAGPGGGVTVFVEWSDYTRRRIERAFLIGRDDTGRDQRPDRMTGTFVYGPVAATVTAPDWARRHRLFMGLRNCRGAVLFDDIDTFAARPGVAPGEARPAPAAAPGPAPLLEPATLDFTPIALTGVVNRALRDERADDGEGGWTDQGPAADLRGLDPGRHVFEGVPFEIHGPLSCVVLHSPARPQSRLPERVTIPVNRRADVVYFLHNGAWVSDDVELARYAVRYTDGTTADIPLIGGVNILDWALGREARFSRQPPAGQRAVIAASLGGGALFPTVNLYLLEWLNPHPSKTIQEIEFVSANRGVPILLGITVGTKQ